jgi:flagellar biosynthesis protein FlhF
MRIKSYFAESIQDAMERAREELGSDAMLVHSKNTEPELRQLGKYEVVFGISNTEARPPGTVETQKPDSKQPTSAADPVLHELSDLRKELEVIRRSIARQGKTAGFRRFTPELEDMVVRLERSGFSTEFAEEMVASVEAGSRTEPDRSVRQLHSFKENLSREALESAVLAEIERRIQVSAELGPREGDARAVMLVGPPGSGKTSTLMKLALQYGLKMRTPVDIFTTDVFRVGAWEQLSRYAQIAGATFEHFQSVAALDASMGRRSGGRLVLIDTPGYSLAEMAEAAEWAEYAEQSRIDVHLVLPATVRTSVALDFAERFKIFGRRKLILTHWDELDSAASACELVAKAGLPVSFITDGQQIPEDLHAASASELARQALPRAKGAKVSAA